MELRERFASLEPEPKKGAEMDEFGEIITDESLEKVDISEFIRRSMVMLLFTLLVVLLLGLRFVFDGSARGPVRCDGMGAVRIGDAAEDRSEVIGGEVNVDFMLGSGLAEGEMVAVMGGEKEVKCSWSTRRRS